MANRLTHAQIDRLDNAVAESGFTLLRADGHAPRFLDVRMPSSTTVAQIAAYVWRIRPGGGGAGVRPDDERRVQMTRPGAGDFQSRPSVSTLLIGYDPDSDIYAAWDFNLRRWTRNSPGHPSGPPVVSPSAQTRQSKLDEAQRAGIAFYVHPINERLKSGKTRGAEEVVANFRPDHLGAYLAWLDPSLVPRASSPAAAAVQRRREASLRLVRDARFVRAVVSAYGHRCCFCGLGASIVEAAHIKPVADGGPDTVDNGIALCPTHHRLFDRGFVLISPTSFAITANTAKMARSKISKRERTRVSQELAETPMWPSRPSDRPHPRFIKRHRALHR